MRQAVCMLAVAALLAGCSLAPTYRQPLVPLPARWTDGAAAGPGVSTDAVAVDDMDWRAFVTDATLAGLVERALAHNRDLRQVLLDVEVARAQYRIRRADRVPGVQLEAGGSRQRTPESSDIQASSQAGAGLAAFELDLFGRLHNLSQAGLQEYLAGEDVAQGARISLVAEVVQAYLVRAGAQQRYLLATRTLETREASLHMVAARRASGMASELDHQEAVGLVQQVRADLEGIDREFRQAGNALALLVGDPDVVARLPRYPDADVLLVQEIVPGMPSALAARRPDIRAAEHRLQARNADIGAARAAFFPRISLTGFLGSASPELSGLFAGGSRAWSFAPQLSLPILDGGRARAGLDMAWVRRDVAVAAYEYSIQAAFRDVSDALAAVDTLRREEHARHAMLQSSAETLRLSAARYRSGIDDHLRYLDAQRSHFASETALIAVRTQRQVGLTTLFRSLGGGWPAAGQAGRDVARGSDRQ